jgi:hypothetical protein
MQLHKILYIIFLFQIFSVNVYAQEYKEKDFFTLNDSVQTVSVMYNNKAMLHALTVGAITGGAVSGVTAVLLVASGKTGNDMVPWFFFPIAVGGITFVVTTAINYLLNSDDAKIYVNFSSPYQSFNHLGLFSSFAAIITSNSNNLDFSFSFSYRNLNKKMYLPSKISVLFGVGQRMYIYEFPINSSYSGCDISGEESRFGIEALYVNYNNLFSLLYGIETGVQFFNGSLFTYNKDDIIKERNGISPYIKLIGGFNMNFTNWLSWEIAYKYEAYGIYDNLKPEKANIINRNHFLSTTVAIYF